MMTHLHAVCGGFTRLFNFPSAFYPEPHLHINVLKNGQVDLLVTSQGGYPSPSLQWLMGSSKDITNETQMQLQQDDRTKLYSVNSKLNVTRGHNSSITFILKNEDLGQEIIRNIDLFSGELIHFIVHRWLLNWNILLWCLYYTLSEWRENKKTRIML